MLHTCQNFLEQKLTFLTGVSASWQLCSNSGLMKYAQAKFQLEKDIISELANKYRDIIECKKTDFRSIKSKNDTWKRVMKEFNAQSGVTKYS